MKAVTRKYNPGFLTDDELVASFCVRTHEFDSMIEMLSECSGSANPHRIVIGPHGSGKTILLLRVAVELRRDAALASYFFPIIFAEESYEVAAAGEFWLEALSRLATQVPDPDDADALRRTWGDLRTIRDDRMLGDRCLGALLDFADREGKRLVLVVENMNTMFADMADAEEAGWRLRRVLQTEPRIVLLASATSRFDAIDKPDRALYDLFRVLTLRPLNTDECATLWESVSGRCRAPDAIQALRILTGGNPRLLGILARFGAGLSFRDLLADLLDLVDDLTVYFKSHLEALPAQERRVYLALADLWKPAMAREIADRARLDTSKCSAQLARLMHRGAVEVIGGSPRRKLYYLVERLYNIYYLMRRARGPDPLLEALVRFMAWNYAPAELRDIGLRIAGEAGDLDRSMQSLYRTVFIHLVALPIVAPYRKELLAAAPSDYVAVAEHLRRDGAPTRTPDLEKARALFDRAFSLAGLNRLEDAIAVCDDAMRRFEDCDSPLVLGIVARVPVYKAAILVNLNRSEEALAVYDDAVRRFGDSDVPGVRYWVARALNGKGVTLERLKRSEEAIATYGDAANRFGRSESPGILVEVVDALVRKGVALESLARREEAVAAYDEAVWQFGNSDSPHALDRVTIALVRKGGALEALNRWEEAVATYGEAVRRCEGSAAGSHSEVVAKALVSQAALLGLLNRPEEALTAWDEVVRRFEMSDDPTLLPAVATAFSGKGVLLGVLNRSEEALAAWDEVIRRLGPSDEPGDFEFVATALVEKGATLVRLDRPEEALAAWEEVVRRFGTSDDGTLGDLVGDALLKKAAIELKLKRYQEAIVTVGRALDQKEMESPRNQWRYHLIGAFAKLNLGDLSACEQEVTAILAILPDLDAPPIELLDMLKAMSLALGPKQMRKLIIASPSERMLLPFTTALERDLGIESRVPREVEEVAEDIRRDFARLRKGRYWRPDSL